MRQDNLVSASAGAIAQGAATVAAGVLLALLCSFLIRHPAAYSDRVTAALAVIQDAPTRRIV
jgi:hypothetical protein